MIQRARRPLLSLAARQVNALSHKTLLHAPRSRGFASGIIVPGTPRSLSDVAKLDMLEVCAASEFSLRYRGSSC